MKKGKNSARILLLVAGVLLIAAIIFEAFLAFGGPTVLSPKGKENVKEEGEKVEEVYCTCPTINISLQPYDDFTQKEAVRLKEDLEKNLSPLLDGVTLCIDVLPNKPLEKSLMNEAGTRYRGDKIINSLAKDADKCHIIIALTHKDISISYKGKPDWGVLGLSLIPKKACVVSTYRLKNKRDLWKVTSHEFIHTCFNYNHCPNDNLTCIMKDAKGHADFSNKTKLCEQCSKAINNH